ncbi:hypothetical protein ACFFTM_18815 [Pseudoduganella plicata]|uniref:Uncharacterized protein n=1 Tax=Pseudoduganella plicata TaxID=321984 RepID=A0A4P7BAG5_9BURK|nr:hypothetical protein [Pseudoduganella plicata]QBQ34983.1 hypothetical protein E1742_01425 [Pseudoduganella plicata]GGZ06526.1 hypothetical protein GCM10007388_45100 [Pseudoduganella plicata]
MRRFLALAIACFCAGPALLQPAAAQTTFTTLGRLFTTPGERMALDQQRSTMAAQPAGTAAMPGQPGPAAGASVGGMPGQPGEATPAPAPPPPAAPVRLNGVVRRHDGRATIWVDNEARDTMVRGSTAVRVPVDVGGRRVLLKPGQSYDPNSGTVLDAQQSR